MNLNQITIPCRDYALSVAFYRTLGFTQIVDSPPRYARFESGNGATFSIHHSTSTVMHGDFIVYFEVDDVDRTVVKLKKSGIVFDHEPVDQDWLWREAYTRDPAGNVICIYHAGRNRRFPPWRIDQNPG